MCDAYNASLSLYRCIDKSPYRKVKTNNSKSSIICHVQWQTNLLYSLSFWLLPFDSPLRRVSVCVFVCMQFKIHERINGMSNRSCLLRLLSTTDFMPRSSSAITRRTGQDWAVCERRKYANSQSKNMSGDSK